MSYLLPDNDANSATTNMGPALNFYKWKEFLSVKLDIFFSPPLSIAQKKPREPRETA